MKKYIALMVCFMMVLCVLSGCTDAPIELEEQKATLSATSMNVKMGQSAQLNVLNYAGDIRWSSSAPSIATVTATGVVEAVAIGSVAITATLSDGRTMTCVVDVKPGESSIQSLRVTSIYSDSNDITVDYNNGGTVRLKAVCTPNVNERLTWSTSDEMLASVDANGVVTVWGNGIAEIKATAMNGVEGSCKVRIKNVPADVKPKVVPKTDTEIPVIVDDGQDDGVVSSKFTSSVPVSSPSARTSVIISDKNVYLKVGESFTLKYAVGNTKEDDVTWMSSNKAVAIVKNGRIVAVGDGRAVISAVTGDGAVASCQVAVGEKEIKSMKKEVSETKK